MAVYWPSALPINPARYSEQKGPVSIFTATDNGPGKSRRRFTKSVKKGSMEYLLTIAQAVLLNNFWENEMQGGAVKVVINHPWGNVPIEFSIKEAPKFSDDGPLAVRASFDVEYI